jgi:curved DNA-binding protein CbpA
MHATNGIIKDLAIPRLLQDLRRDRRTGTAVFEREGEAVKVFFRQGDVMSAASNGDDDRLGELLLGSGKITKDQLDKSFPLMKKSGKRLGAVLFEMRAITPHDLVAVVKLQVRLNILDLFRWREGKYRFEDGLLPGAEIVPFPMNTDELVLEGVRALDGQIMQRSLPPLNTLVRPAAGPSPLLQGSFLNEDELKVFSFIEGSNSIQDICCLSGLGDFNTLKSIYVLLALRMAETGEVKAQQEVSCDVVREAYTAKDDLKKAGPEAEKVSIVREMIQHAYDSLGLQNYYEVLGVGHSATPEEIKKAYFSLAKLYHPDRHSDPQLADMKQKLETLFESINEAFSVLSVQGKRNQYNLDLSSGTKTYRKKTPQPLDEEENKKLSATAQFTEGMKQFRVQNFWGAEEAFRWAVRFDPSNPEYVYHQGLALARMPRRRHEAEEHFVKAVGLAPSKIEYYLELGNFYEKNGLKEKALTVYRNALKRDPNSDKIRQAIKSAGG